MFFKPSSRFRRDLLNKQLVFGKVTTNQKPAADAPVSSDQMEELHEFASFPAMLQRASPNTHKAGAIRFG